MTQTQIQGNTIRLRRVFTDFDGAAYDPTDITLKLYDTQKGQIGETIAVGVEHQVSPGIYEVEVALPVGHDIIIYEFSGTDLRGNPDVVRRSLLTPWTG
ncbi:MAG TPA: hypothetical protein GX401_10080 [Clostridiales bacterium]|jgi:hypothetical protein|nr:hypothetical protein [Clostridiales bacterium]